MAAVATSSGFDGAAAAAWFGHTPWQDGHEAAHRPCRYWPCELLSAFMLHMAAQGCCVNESMMLGSREYAIEKLTHAHTLNDDGLREIAVRMFSYFDDEPVHAVQMLVNAGHATGSSFAH